MFTMFFITVVLFFVSVYYFTTRKFSYWEKKHVPHRKPRPLFGNFQDLLLSKRNMGSIEQDICQNFKDEPLVGAYLGTEPVLIVKDPELIKLVTTKDFYYFSNREISEHANKENLAHNLFSTSGDDWKILRQNLTPLFSSSKMKNMFYLIEACSKTFEKLLDHKVNSSKSLEMRQVIGSFTMDCIGTCAFGLDTKAMDETLKSNPFRVIGDVIFEATFIRNFMSQTRLIWPRLFYLLGLKSFPTQLDNFFTKLMTGVFKEREGTDRSNLRHDFVDLILNFKEKKYISGDSLKNLKHGGKERKQLNVDDKLLAAQCFVFFGAGYETSATISSYTLYELAKDMEAQEKARAEIDGYLKKHNGQLNYECVNELPYLEQCIDEALRLYPVLGVITREVVEPYTFPGTDITVEKGMRIHLPVYYIQRDPKYFPSPNKFDPERFSADQKRNITPYSYLPFGEGPRICIGMRFAKMQMLAGLVTVLKKYRVELTEDMPRTIVYNPKSLVTQSKDGIKLKLTPRTDREPIMYRT